MSSPTPAFRVVIGTTNWAVNGVNVFSANLARGLLAAGIPAHILLTEDRTALVELRETLMPFPAAVPFVSLPVSPIDGWGLHWGAMVRHLEEAAPCVYIPNYDWRHSCICPRLSNEVVVVGVVHSDDPLHYDHVRRLGPYWNAVVAVSSAVAERTAAACPAITDRIVTIPIGVRLPRVWPRRSRASSVLRLVYHGALKQHQKRVLDLVAIVEAAADLGVAVELSIAGAGADEAALRMAAAPLEARGLIHFLGIIPPDETAAMLEAQDVYLLPSEFEGMPNALIEAMGSGCVPIVTRTASGIPELIRDGENGFLVRVGDTAGFAEHLRTLSNDPERLTQISQRAFHTAATGPFRAEDMIRSYERVFENAWSDVREGRFARPQGPIAPPPPTVAGIGLFPVPLRHVVPDIGTFPSADDAEDYTRQVEAVLRRPDGPRATTHARTRVKGQGSSLSGVRVIVSTPEWTDNAVNLWSEDLVRGLRQAGLDARVLLTEAGTALAHSAEAPLARPSDLPFDELRVNGDDNWGARWGAVVRELEGAPPCIYFPTYDIRQSSVVPALSNRVTVIGTLHDNGSLQTECAGRLGKYWNAAVATSLPVARDVRRQLPKLEDRLTTIPEGMTIPAAYVEKPYLPSDAITVLIVGALHDGPGDTYWMEALTRVLAKAGSFQIVVVNPAPSIAGRLAELGAQVVSHANREEWLALCRTSRFVVANNLGDKAKRPKVVEAMGHGCIPVSMRSEPTDDPLVRADDTVVTAPAGWRAVVKDLRRIAADPDRRTRMAIRAHSAAQSAGYRTDQMIDWYLELFQRLMTEAANGWFQRPRGLILPPPAQVDGQVVFTSELTHHTPLGTFPTPQDAERFREEAGIPPRSGWSWR